MDSHLLELRYAHVRQANTIVLHLPIKKMAAKGDLLLFSSIAKAFGNILSKDIEKEVVEE